LSITTPGSGEDAAPSPGGIWNIAWRQPVGEGLATMVLVCGEKGAVTGHVEWLSELGASGREFWDLRGTDFEKTLWIGTIAIAADAKGDLSGEITWLASDVGCGREHVTATYDAKGGVLEMKGTKVESGGGMGVSKYKAVLTSDGARLEKGACVGDKSFPGGWNAKRIDVR
jgi:hypothetical protein